MSGLSWGYLGRIWVGMLILHVFSSEEDNLPLRRRLHSQLACFELIREQAADEFEQHFKKGTDTLSLDHLYGLLAHEARG